MNTNPTITELNNSANFEQLESIYQPQIKEFIKTHMQKNNTIVPIFMIYQLLMVLLGGFIIVRAFVLAYKGDFDYFIISILTLIFCFTLLIVFHELIHGIALKIIGAPKISFGAHFKKFIFFAEADQFVMNKRQFYFVAILPLVVIKIVSLLGIAFFWNSPSIYIFLILMSIHSLFCAGDIGLIAYMNQGKVVYTYDNKAEKTSYFFKRITPAKP